MKSILEPDFLSPANVNKYAYDCDKNDDTAYDDDKFPAIDLMALLEALDPLFIDLLTGVVVFEGPNFAGTC